MSKVQNQNSAKGKSAAPKRRNAMKTGKPSSNGKSQAVQSVAASYYKPSNYKRPNIKSVGSGDARIRISHAEYIGPVAGSVAYAVTAYSINPGLLSSFPWLATLAGNYESYRFIKLKYCFRTLVGSSTAGTIAMAIDYDAADAAPASLMQLYQYNGSRDSQVWAAETCLIADGPDMHKLPQNYVRQGILAANQDIKTYDIGTFYIATQDMAGASAIGRLWVEYELELITPQAQVSGISLSAKVVSGGTVDKANVFGSSAVITGGLQITAVGKTLTFNQPGQYIVVQNIVGTGLNAASTVTGSATFTKIEENVSGSLFAYLEIAVTVTDFSQTLVIDWSVTNTSVTGSETRLAPYAYALA